MTYKAMILLYRRDDVSAADFQSWWHNQHAPLATQLPGVRRVVFNSVADLADNMPDGVTELWFDSREAFDAAYASDVGARVAVDSMTHVRDRLRLLVTEHAIV